MKRIFILPILLFTPLCIQAQNVTLTSKDRPAAQIFREIMLQSDKNFIYQADAFKDLRLSVDVKDEPLDKVLKKLFRNTDITYKIKGKNVVLKLAKKHKKINNDKIIKPILPRTTVSDSVNIRMLDELTVVSRLESPVVETAEIGARKVTADEIRRIPAILGETDVIKALQSLPGVTEGTEGMAGMHVHGGAADENLYMLDNVPVYQVNHLGGLFSAFNNDVVRYIDFYKSSIPAKFDGRLSSFMDVRLKDGLSDDHHGTARLGLTSGAFNIGGPIGEKTTYLFGLRRSWFDVISVPMFAIINSQREEKMKFRYSFMDINGKLTHRFNDRAKGIISIYYGDDELHTDSHEDQFDYYGWKDCSKSDFNWGNLIVQLGLNYKFSDNLKAEFSASYTKFFSSLRYKDSYEEVGDVAMSTYELIKMNNSVNDWIIRGDFAWTAAGCNRLGFGASLTFHSFLPTRMARHYQYDDVVMSTRDSVWSMHGTEGKVYIEDEWTLNDKLSLNAGLNASYFHINEKTTGALSPRLSVAYRATDNISVKGAYAHTVQYVHQLSQSYLSLPTDQWIPISGKFKPQFADKLSLGVYWQSHDRSLTLSAETYYKKMRNLLDYTDEYYLNPPLTLWDSRLTSGSGTAKGIDIFAEKDFGKIFTRVSYSLAWSDRIFAEKNGGRSFPARFDNRHTINVTFSWKINDKVELNAFWTGHSGNRFTLLQQNWMIPTFDKFINGSQISGGYEGVIVPDSPPYDSFDYFNSGVPLKGSINNYRLPFYHRLDLSCIVRNKRGYWTFGLYNAYNHMNTVAIVRDYQFENRVGYDSDSGYWSITDVKPVFKKLKLFPIIPSISYTWEF